MSDSTANDATLTVAQLLKDKCAHLCSGGHIYIVLDDEGNKDE